MLIHGTGGRRCHKEFNKNANCPYCTLAKQDEVIAFVVLIIMAVTFCLAPILSFFW